MIRALALLLLVGLASGCNSFRTFFPSSSHDTTPPELPAELASPSVLVFSKTNGFRHEEAIPAGLTLLEKLASERGWSLFHSENGAVFTPELLARFDVAVWHNTSGDVLSEEQKAAFKTWLTEGGGFVGLHGAGGDPSYEWTWYVEELVGAQFIGHTMGPQFQEATAVVENREHPATRDLPETFRHVEEWYSFDQSVRDKGFEVLVRVDETTYSPELHLLWMDTDLRMGDDHPVVWSRCLGKGRTFFSALGHQTAAYERGEMASLLGGAVDWAAGRAGTGCEGS